MTNDEKSSLEYSEATMEYRNSMVRIDCTYDYSKLVIDRGHCPFVDMLHPLSLVARPRYT